LALYCICLGKGTSFSFTKICQSCSKVVAPCARPRSFIKATTSSAFRRLRSDNRLGSAVRFIHAQGPPMPVSEHIIDETFIKKEAILLPTPKTLGQLAALTTKGL
jgi:hypothetical protein